MTSIHIKTNGSSITAKADGKLTSGMVGISVTIEYDESWSGLTKTAVFKVGDFVRDRKNIETETTVPWEVMRRHGGQLLVGLEGRDGDGNIVMPTIFAPVGTIYQGALSGIPGSPNPDFGEDKQSNAVLFVPQTLTEEQQAQARSNIGAASVGEGGVTESAVLYAPQTLSKEQKAQARENIGAPAEGIVLKEVHTITVKYGEALLTDHIVTLGAGWTGNLTDGFTHTAGNTEPLTFNIGSAHGERYLVGAHITTGNVSCVRLTIGNSYPTDPYGVGNPWTWCVQSVDGGSLKITPVSDWAGTIANVDCRKITDDGEWEFSLVVDNIAHEAMSNHLSGFWDIQIGGDALRDSINTTRCIAIGQSALRELQSGGRNICLGTVTLSHMKYGEDNIAIGADSGLYVQEAHGCVSIGKSSMSSGAKYKDCIAIGHAALYGNANTDVQNNIGIGVWAGNGVTTAKNNIFIGKNAGYKTTTGYNNVYIGDGAAKDATTGAFNTAVGVNAAIPSTLSNCVVVGGGAAATKSKQAVFGSDNITETLLKGNLIVRGTDGVKRQIVFNEDGTVGWTTVE